jgi:uncharacterized protein with PIN domain
VRRPDALTRAFRSSCSQCGFALIEWLSLVEAREAGLPVDEAVTRLGKVESVWRCPSCGECGFFGPTEVW